MSDRGIIYDITIIIFTVHDDWKAILDHVGLLVSALVFLECRLLVLVFRLLVRLDRVYPVRLVCRFRHWMTEALLCDKPIKMLDERAGILSKAHLILLDFTCGSSLITV